MKKWYQRITPFVIICAFAVVAMLYFLVAESKSPAEVRYGVLVLSLPLVLGMVIVDVILRYVIKKQLWLWVVEIVLLLGLVYFWIVSE